LKKIPATFTDVPDKFKLWWTIHMTVWETKSVMVWSKWGSYKYRKSNNNLWWTWNKNYGVGVASAGTESDTQNPDDTYEGEIEEDDESEVIPLPEW
jgi:hypothetical protein